MTQLTLDAAQGEQLKQAGLASAESDASFLSTMRDVAQEISQASGFVTSDNLRIVADKMGLSPRSPNSWGAIFHGKHWQVIGRCKSAVPGNHRREIKMWRWVA
jgi:hypothetical protein